jgi:hypothetical protein
VSAEFTGGVGGAMSEPALPARTERKVVIIAKHPIFLWRLYERAPAKLLFFKTAPG